jgi:phage tail-like protein
MTTSKILYRNLPLYARLADDRAEVLRHICNAVQPFFDDVDRIITRQEDFYSPDTIPEAFLDWLGQWVGLGTFGGEWLGTGLNPSWPASHKREVIKRAWRYWQIQGTELGIREAYFLWLRWKATPDRLTFYQPFGKTPDDMLPGWWTFQTQFGSHLLLTTREFRHFGSGDYWQQSRAPGRKLIQPTWQWAFNVPWTDLTLEREPMEMMRQRSQLGPRNLWQDVDVYDADQWRQIFPEVHKLQEEIVDALVSPMVRGWLNTPPIDVLIQESSTSQQSRTITEFQINGFQWGHWWPYSASAEIVTEFAETTESSFGNWPGFGFHSLFGRSKTVEEETAVVSESILQGNGWNGQWGADWPFHSHFGQFPGEEEEIQEEAVLVAGNWEDDAASFFSAYGSGRQWYVEARSEIVVTGAELVRFGGTPYWHWDASVSQRQSVQPLPMEERPRAAEWWYAPFMSRTETTVTRQVENLVSCDVSGGVPISIQTGSHVEEITETTIVPGNQTLEWQPEEATIVEQQLVFEGIYPGFGFSSWLIAGQQGRPPTIETLSIDTGGLTSDELAIETLRPVTDLIYTVDGALPMSSWWYTPPRYEDVVVAEGSPGKFAIKDGSVFTFLTPFNRGFQWFFSGDTSTTTRTKVTPTFREEILCNVPASWTTREIDWINVFSVDIDAEALTFLEQFPEMQELGAPQHWQVAIETNDELILLSPSVFFWQSLDGSQRGHQFSDKTPQIFMEAVFQGGRDRHISDVALLAGIQCIKHRSFSPPLAASSAGVFGFRFKINIIKMLNQAI